MQIVNMYHFREIEWDGGGGKTSSTGRSKSATTIVKRLYFVNYLVQTAGSLFDPLALLRPGTVMTSLQQYGANFFCSLFRFISSAC